MKLAISVGTPFSIIKMMLDMAQVGSEDVIYDLGSRDGRILITAVKEFGAKKAVGYEIRKDLCDIAESKINQMNLQNKIVIINGNMLNADLSKASVITLYLSTEANELLRPKLEKYARSHARVISHYYPLRGWRSARKIDLQKIHYNGKKYIGMLYLYIIPEAFKRKQHLQIEKPVLL